VLRPPLPLDTLVHTTSLSRVPLRNTRAYAYLRPCCPSPERHGAAAHEGLPSAGKGPGGESGEEGWGPDPRQVAPRAPCPSTRKGKGSFSKWPAGWRLTPADLGCRNGLGRPHCVLTPPTKPRTREAGRPRAPQRTRLDFFQYSLGFGIRLPVAGLPQSYATGGTPPKPPGRLASLRRPRPSQVRGPAPRPAPPTPGQPRPRHFSSSRAPRGQPPRHGWPGLALGLGQVLCVSFLISGTGWGNSSRGYCED
jgi:hypothetical protein